VVTLKYSVAYIHPERFERELAQFALENADTQPRSYMNLRAFLEAVNTTDFDCVLVADTCDGDLLQFESDLHECGHLIPVLRVSEGSDLPAVLDAFRRGQGAWLLSHPAT
jgi:FixJ family two-component response regulator